MYCDPVDWFYIRKEAEQAEMHSSYQWVEQALALDQRSDGRTCNAFRRISVETQVLLNCNGSCAAQLGHTKVLVGVKASLEVRAI